MKVIYRGFDGLDVALQGNIPASLAGELAKAKERAAIERRDALIEHNGVKMHVAETGAKGGYAFRCDTGPDGATWFFKKPNRNDPWGVRVSIKSLCLALYGLGDARARLYAFLDAIGVQTAPEGVSIGRVDYAVDFLAPGFRLVPEHFVMHSHTTRADHIEDMQRHGPSGRVSSVTVGKMPGRQVIVYDKRSEVITRQKVEWWEIWNAGRRLAKAPELDPRDRDGSQIWRVELRAGKKHLKDRWGITTWADLDAKLGDLLLRAAADIRLAEPAADGNRSRWPNAPLWDAVTGELQGDLGEMVSGAEPGAVKEVIRRHQCKLLATQAIGTAASWSAAQGYRPDQAREAIEGFTQYVENYARENPAALAEKIGKADDRYVYLGE